MNKKKYSFIKSGLSQVLFLRQKIKYVALMARHTIFFIYSVDAFYQCQCHSSLLRIRIIIIIVIITTRTGIIIYYNGHRRDAQLVRLSQF